jgi:hypothetical protein
METIDIIRWAVTGVLCIGLSLAPIIVISKYDKSKAFISPMFAVGLMTAIFISTMTFLSVSMAFADDYLNAAITGIIALVGVSLPFIVAKYVWDKKESK